MSLDKPPGDFQTQLALTTGGLVPKQGTDQFTSATATFNTRVHHAPAAVVCVSTTAQLVSAVRFAAEHGMRVAVRSTGHGMWSVAGDTLIVEVSRMNSIEIDSASSTATIGPGATWHRILATAGEQGYGGLAGSSPGVGAVGFLLGGGIGPVSRTFGFSADHVREIDVVTADGDQIRASANENADLFWAMCGGGGLGIVSSMTIDLVPDAGLRAGGVYFAIEQAEGVLHRWRDWVEDITNSVSTSVAIVDIPPLDHVPEPIRGKRVVHVRYAEVDGEDTAAPAVLSFGTPIFGRIAPMRYRELGEIHAKPSNAKPTVQDSILLGTLPAQGIDRFLELSLDNSLALNVRELRALGGAMTAPQRTDNAVAGREAAFTFFALGQAPPEQVAPVSHGLDLSIHALAPWGSGGTFAGFAGEGRPRERIDRAWQAAALQRLRVVRAHVDPTGRLDPNMRWTPAQANMP